MAAAKAGSQVTVSGFRDTDPEGRTALRLVSLTVGSQTVRDTPPVRPTTPPTEETTTVRGTVQRLSQLRRKLDRAFPNLLPLLETVVRHGYRLHDPAAR